MKQQPSLPLLSAKPSETQAAVFEMGIEQRLKSDQSDLVAEELLGKLDGYHNKLKRALKYGSLPDSFRKLTLLLSAVDNAKKIIHTLKLTYQRKGP